MPESCPDVPAEVLNPRSTWKDKDAYDATAADLTRRFANNFKQFEDKVDAKSESRGDPTGFLDNSGKPTKVGAGPEPPARRFHAGEARAYYTGPGPEDMFRKVENVMRRILIISR